MSTKRDDHNGPELPTRGPVSAGGTGSSAWTSAPHGIFAEPAFDAWQTWRDDPTAMGAVAAAILAASPHNTQPWWFRTCVDRIDVLAEWSRNLGHADPFYRELVIGVGCALENLVLAAEVRGLAPSVSYWPDPDEPDLAARVTLRSAHPHPSALYEMIGDRHTNRGAFRPDSAPGHLLDSVTALAGDEPDGRAEVCWITDPARRAELGGLLVAAADAVTADELMSKDAYAWVRAGAAEVHDHADGLTMEGQGLSATLTAVVKALPTTRCRADKFWVERTRDVHTATAPAYGVIVVDDPLDKVTQLVGGRLLQRIWLAATAYALAVQPMNQITERNDRDVSRGRRPVFGPALDRIVDRPGRSALLVFRIGAPVRAGRRSPRRDLDAVARPGD